MRWPRGLEGRLCYGGDYNPEQWEPEVWSEDVRLMRRAGVNLVSVGVFAWSRLEPREGEYDFDWLDSVLDLLHHNGIGVGLATPTASPPPWFSFAYPDALPVTRDGVRLVHGSRDTYCPSAPAYRAAARRIATELGRRYGKHPALALWHVHNEYGTTCWCDHVAGAFRRWLRGRYATLDRLNEAWTGSFWSQVYADWEHILPPRTTQYLPNPTQLLDFRRFCSDELLACFTEQRDVLRPLSPEVPVTTNFLLGSWVSVDHRRWAAEVDLVAIDHYPGAAGGRRAEEETAFVADRARGWAGGPWLLLEQAPHHITEAGRTVPNEPGRGIRLSLAHVARGSIGAMFFQWRASRGGAEMFHSAMVPHSGEESRAFAESVELGRLIARLGDAGEAPISTDVAVLYDDESGWALQSPGLPAPVDYPALVRGVHAALWRAGVTVDVVSPVSDLTPYRLVIAPALFLVTDVAAAAISSYVDGGGTLVLTYLSDVVDADLRVRPGGYPGGLRDVVGVVVEEQHPGPPWTERLRLEGAEVVAEEPMITRHPYGQGVAWYVAGELDDAGWGRFLAAGSTTGSTTPGVELVRRGDWLFAINHTGAEQEIEANGEECLTGTPASGRWRLPAGGVAVFREGPK